MGQFDEQIQARSQIFSKWGFDYTQGPQSGPPLIKLDVWGSAVSSRSGVWGQLG